MALLNKNPMYLVGNEAENDVSEYIVSKGYLPHEKDLPMSSVLKNVGKSKMKAIIKDGILS